jgi:hypothetical protein
MKPVTPEGDQSPTLHSMKTGLQLTMIIWSEAGKQEKMKQASHAVRE